jgi:site-specific DNA recombinase
MTSYRSLRSAFYARVAASHQFGSDGLAHQIAVLRKRMATDGVPLDPELAFVDDGYSGVSLERPALERLRQLVAQGRLDRLYVAAPQRLTRNTAHFARLLDEFHRAVVDVIFVDGNASV